ncbi:MAG: folylpolyglutamate synthase/dihydrofolate synthase family protein [Verrucomicrobiota bacterium]
MTYDENIEWLYSTIKFGIKLGLENPTKLLVEFGVDAQLEGRKILHVAGTNGKGSVCAFSEQILSDAGLKVGLYTSPHLVTIRERFKINGELIAEEELSRLIEFVRSKTANWEHSPTFFEITFLVGLLAFCQADCDVIILETGLGGRLDATNSVKADVSVITQISLDHQAILGDTIREIAGEKAGIIKPEVPVIVADVHPEARDVIGRRALTLGVPYIEAHPIPEDWILGIPGAHQRENASLAVEATCRIEEDKLTLEGIQKSIAKTVWPGRFQLIEEENLILDGAHNAGAIAALVETWHSHYPEQKTHIVFGTSRETEADDFLALLEPIAASFTLVPFTSDRSATAEELNQLLEKQGSIPTSLADSVTDALAGRARTEAPTLIVGSLFLVGEVIASITGVDLEVTNQ